MSSLRSICELAWRQVFPNPGDEAAITKEEFIETGKLQYAWEIWRASKEESRSEGFYDIPSVLFTEITLSVKDKEASLKGLNILRSLPNDKWLANIGGLTSECKYVATTVNRAQLLDDDDSLDDNVRTYLIVGDTVKFPRGTHVDPLPIIYANNGAGIDEDETDVDDVLGAIVRSKLIDIYSKKGV